MMSSFDFKLFKQYLHREFGATVSYKRLKARYVTSVVDKHNHKTELFDPQNLMLFAWFLIHPALEKSRDWELLRRLFFKHHSAELKAVIDKEYESSTTPKRLPVADQSKLLEAFVQLKQSGALVEASYMQLAHIIVSCFDVPQKTESIKNLLFNLFLK